MMPTLTNGGVILLLLLLGAVAVIASSIHTLRFED